MQFYMSVLWLCSLTSRLVLSTPACAGHQVHVSEGNWTVILQGDWMIKFYAPWCPACNAVQGAWLALAESSSTFCVASADVSLNAGLSGRFFITSLPTIYHVKDGDFRLYSGERSERRMREFVENGWSSVQVVPWYSSPTSLPMCLLAYFFRFSALLKETHTHLTEDLQVPSWLAYLSFAIVTILTGLLLGLCIVFVCDFSSDRGHHKRQALHKKDDDRFKSMDVIEEQLSHSEQEEEEEGEEEEEEEGADGDAK